MYIPKSLIPHLTISGLESKVKTPLNSQVGEGAYTAPYRSFKIQPVEFLQKNKMGWCESNAIKYLCRFRNKNGLEDLKKARHYIDLLIEMEYGADKV